MVWFDTLHYTIHYIKLYRLSAVLSNYCPPSFRVIVWSFCVALLVRCLGLFTSLMVYHWLGEQPFAICRMFMECSSVNHDWTYNWHTNIMRLDNTSHKTLLFLLEWLLPPYFPMHNIMFCGRKKWHVSFCIRTRLVDWLLFQFFFNINSRYHENVMRNVKEATKLAP